MKKNVSGFSMLFVLMLIAALSMVAISFMRTSGFLSGLAGAREAQEYQYWACLGLKSYAQALLANGGTLPVEPIYMQHWPISDSRYQGVIRFSLTDAEIITTVQLRDQKTVLKELTFTTKKLPS
jgi:hypothetical protein